MTSTINGEEAREADVATTAIASRLEDQSFSSRQRSSITCSTNRTAINGHIILAHCSWLLGEESKQLRQAKERHNCIGSISICPPSSQHAGLLHEQAVLDAADSAAGIHCESVLVFHNVIASEYGCFRNNERSHISKGLDEQSASTTEVLHVQHQCSF